MYSIAPSILSADFSKLGEEINKVQVQGVEYLHIDVMDGHFVPNITIGPQVVKCLKPLSTLMLDVHLMVEEPEKYIDDFAKAGSDVITFHIEATRHPERLLQYIKSLGIKAGVSLNPATSIDSLKYLYDALDLILVMTVNPGFGGQKLIESTLNKVKELKKIKEENNYNFVIEVDGGVTKENIKQYVNVGAELIVAGNAVFGSSNPRDAVLDLLKIDNKRPS